MTSHPQLDETHDPSLRSWVESANFQGAEFPIQNLPFAVFRRSQSAESFRCGVAIGDYALDIAEVLPMFEGQARSAAMACTDDTLNNLMGLGREALTALRKQLSAYLAVGCQSENRERLEAVLVPIAEIQLAMPFKVGGFTDFFASIHHATNAGSLFRPTNPLLPNYKYVPVGYNGRANSIRLSGPVRRPKGQIKQDGQDVPVYMPTQRLDYEVELGICIGASSQREEPISVQNAWEHVFGVCLLNDWSARDIQAWEYQPLGPFLAKSFATSVSPWVITVDALMPFRTAALKRADGDPSALPHLSDDEDQASGGVSVSIDAQLTTEHMRARGQPAYALSRSDSATLYWTIGQMIAHHTSNGSKLDTGDLLGSGTISGSTSDALGSLLEISAGGSRPLMLPSGEYRTFLEDGDEVVLRGRCQREGFVSIGFGECRGRILAAR